MAKPSTVYKTLILYLLDRSTCPLSNLQIADFFLQEEYADYFKVQEILADLVKLGLIEELKTHENTQYSLTPKGIETLGFSQDKINYEVKEDIKAFFFKNQMQFQMDNYIYSDYRKIGNDSYQVDLTMKEDQKELLKISVNVHTKDMAEAICDNWKTQSSDVYALLMDNLVK